MTHFTHFSAFLLILKISFGLSGYCPQPGDIDESSPNDLQYYLFLEPGSYRQISYGQLSSVPYNQGCPIVFITHGFMDNGLNPWILDFKDKVFSGVGCASVIAVDWSNITSTFNYANLKTDLNLVYPYTAYRTCSAGRWVAALLEEAHLAWGAPYSSMLLAGHSLGAHLFGCAGQAVKTKTGSLVGRIMGMDPAGPCFIGAVPDCRLSADDAAFVDTVRTDVGVFGYVGPVGHVDFYPNGGTNQPGCLTNNMLPDLCNHGFAIVLTPASFVTGGKGFESTLCPNYLSYEALMCSKNAVTQMGYYASRTARGSYYLDTTAAFPFTNNGILRYKITFTSLVGR